MNPTERNHGWSINDRVVIIDKVSDSEFNFLFGAVVSTPHSHVGIDNVEKVVIWGDKPFNELAGSGDDAYEQTFSTSDPFLIHYKDLSLFHSFEETRAWFLKNEMPTDDFLEQIFEKLSLLSRFSSRPLHIR